MIHQIYLENIHVAWLVKVESQIMVNLTQFSLQPLERPEATWLMMIRASLILEKLVNQLNHLFEDTQKHLKKTARIYHPLDELVNYLVKLMILIISQRVDQVTSQAKVWRETQTVCLPAEDLVDYWTEMMNLVPYHLAEKLVGY